MPICVKSVRISNCWGVTDGVRRSLPAARAAGTGGGITLFFLLPLGSGRTSVFFSFSPLQEKQSEKKGDRGGEKGLQQFYGQEETEFYACFFEIYDLLKENGNAAERD